MKKWKQMISLVMICVLLFPFVAVNAKAEPTSSAAATQDRLLFTEKFVDSVKELQATGWSGLDKFLVSNTGELLTATNSNSVTYLNGHKSAGDWTNYTVEVDAIITDTEFQTNSKGRNASVLVAVPKTAAADAQNGYEFIVGRNIETGKGSCVLKDRTGGGQDSKTVNCDINFNQMYTLKVEVNRNTIKCYIDGELMISKHIAGVQELKGTFGLRGQGNQVKFDNVTVRENVFWFTEEFHDSADVLEQTGWTGLSDFVLSTNGELMTNTNSKSYTYLTGREGTNEWNNYIVETDMTITDTAFPTNSVGRMGCVLVAVPENATTDSGFGYEFLVSRRNDNGRGQCQLKDRTGGGQDSKTINCTLNLNQTYRVKVAVIGNTIECYIDGVLMISKEIEGVETLTGTIGLRGQGNQIKFDDVTVRDQAHWVYEDFSRGLAANGWTNASAFNISAGEMLLANKNNKYTYISGSSNWSNYTVEADVIVTNESLHATANGRFAGILVAASENSTNAAAGYEYFLYHNKNDDKQGCQIKDRTGGGVDGAVVSHEVAWNKVYKVKLEVIQNIIQCYIDDELVAVYATDTVDVLTGTVGLHNSSTTCKFDNILITHTPDKTVGGADEEWKEGMMFQETFNSNNLKVAEHGWDKGRTVIIHNGKAMLNSGVSTMYLTKYAGASEWSNYTYEAEVQIKDYETSTSSTPMISIAVGANNKNKGYEFQVFYSKNKEKTMFQLYDRVNRKSLTGYRQYDYDIDDVVNVKVALRDNAIACYIDGALVTEQVIDGVSTIKGTIGITMEGGCKGVFDNIYVYPTKPEPEWRNKSVWFSDNFKNTDTVLVERGWNNEYELVDGKLVIPGSDTVTNTSMVTGADGASQWDNYTLEADICMIDDINEVSEASSQLNGVVVRASLADPDNSGYHLRMDNNGSLSLQELGGKTGLGSYKGVTIQRGQTYHVAISVYKNQIRCYLDNELVISAVDENNLFPSGTVGFRTRGYTSHVDNIKVYAGGYKASPLVFDELISSPPTGDGNYIYTYIITLCMMGFAGIGIGAYRKRSFEE